MDCGVVNGSKVAPAGTDSVYSKYYFSKKLYISNYCLVHLSISSLFTVLGVPTNPTAALYPVSKEDVGKQTGSSSMLIFVAG